MSSSACVECVGHASLWTIPLSSGRHGLALLLQPEVFRLPGSDSLITPSNHMSRVLQGIERHLQLR